MSEGGAQVWMPVPGAPTRPWGTLASLGLHLLLALAAIWLSPLRPMLAPPPKPVSVEIVTPQQFAALQQDAQPIVRDAPAPPDTGAFGSIAPELTPTLPSAPPDRPSPAAGPHVATRFYAAAMLKEPQMARIRRTLGTLADSEKVMQLCNIEGLEQIRRFEPRYAPDTLVGYAMADPVLSGLTLSAAGGAFRSRRRWFAIAYTCTVSPDYAGVTTFEFTTGDPIPEAEWEAHNLNAADSDE